jgi:hypothetical protein
MWQELLCSRNTYGSRSSTQTQPCPALWKSSSSSTANTRVPSAVHLLPTRRFCFRCPVIETFTSLLSSTCYAVWDNHFYFLLFVTILSQQLDCITSRDHQVVQVERGDLDMAFTCAHTRSVQHLDATHFQCLRTQGHAIYYSNRVLLPVVLSKDVRQEDVCWDHLLSLLSVTVMLLPLCWHFIILVDPYILQLNLTTNRYHSLVFF